MRTVPLAVLLVAFFILGSMVSIPRAHAAPINWTGLAGDGKWETGGNWFGGHVPTSVGNVFIPAGALVTISTTQSIYTLSVDVGATVTCESTCTLTAFSLSNRGTFMNFGTVALNFQLSNDGTFTNFGTVTIGPSFMNGGTFTNRCHGTVNITPTAGTGTFTTDPTCPAVGGVVTTVNAFSILAPWIVVLGLVGCVTAAAVVTKKRGK